MIDFEAELPRLPTASSTSAILRDRDWGDKQSRIASRPILGHGRGGIGRVADVTAAK